MFHGCAHLLFLSLCWTCCGRWCRARWWWRCWGWRGRMGKQPWGWPLHDLTRGCWWLCWAWRDAMGKQSWQGSLLWLPLSLLYPHLLCNLMPTCFQVCTECQATMPLQIGPLHECWLAGFDRWEQDTRQVIFLELDLRPNKQYEGLLVATSRVNHRDGRQGN